MYPFTSRESLPPPPSLSFGTNAMGRHHKSKMTTAVVRDANRVYRLFCQRNPYFALRGRVSIIAHSLGSALVSDVLSTQPTRVKKLSEMTPAERGNEKDFLFDTRLLFLVGSPVSFSSQLDLIADGGETVGILSSFE